MEVKNAALIYSRLVKDKSALIVVFGSENPKSPSVRFFTENRVFASFFFIGRSGGPTWPNSEAPPFFSCMSFILGTLRAKASGLIFKGRLRSKTESKVEK